ncbi:MAG: hypothetical protein DA329_12530, partial [Candidatus Nitrosocosmicus sp.]|nr:hypothetical protein [Candidatus Nitrosocosmicus sp.]
GYDPLDLFFDPQKKSISTNTSLIKGSHGRPFNMETGEGLAAFASNKRLENIPIGSYNGHSVINCIDVFQLVTRNFVA